MPPPEPTGFDGVLHGRIERLAVVAGGLLMLLIVAASGLIARRTTVNISAVAASQVARSVTAELLEAVVSAETGQRGYLLTGRADYLTPYTRSVTRVPALLDQLSRHLPDNPDLPRWRAVIRDKMAELDETVRLEQAGRHADALDRVQRGRGQVDMETTRAIAARLTAAQAATEAVWLDRSQAGSRSLVVVDSIVLVMLVTLMNVVGRRLLATVDILATSRRSLADANAALQDGRGRLEVAVAERTAELTDANDEIQRFAYIVSHDLRAPLLNIIGFTGELEAATERLNRFVSDHLEGSGIEVPPDVIEASRVDLPEAIRFIRTSTAKMDRLITTILRLSREGRRELTPETLDMAALVGGVFDSMRHQADTAHAELIGGPLPPLVSDRVAIEQVMSNLVENALKYGKPDRPNRIEVSGSVQAGWARYEVRDTGRGIAERDHERIFELFRRAGPQSTAGEGIGLAHVRILLRRLGGSIDCESVLDVGSTFVVCLPAILASGGRQVQPGASEVAEAEQAGA